MATQDEALEQDVATEHNLLYWKMGCPCPERNFKRTICQHVNQVARVVPENTILGFFHKRLIPAALGSPFQAKQ